MNFNQANTDLPLPPGDYGFPIIGETICVLSDPDFARKRHRKYGDIFKTHIMGKPTVYIQGREGNRFILSNENEYFVNFLPSTAKILLGDSSIAIQTGDEHLSRRRLLSKSFQPRTLAEYIPSVQAITQQYLQKWEGMNYLKWYDELQDYTFDIACKFLIGLDNASQTPLRSFFETWGKGLFSLKINLPWTNFGRALRSRQKLLAEIENIIRQRQQSLDRRIDALDILLQARDEEGHSLSIKELKNQLLGLLFAGYGTLTSALTSFCLLMAQNPDILSRVRAEQRSFNNLTTLTVEQLKSMTYLDNVLKEVLRIIPPVGGGFRESIRDCEFQGYHIPKGWRFVYQILIGHEDERIFTNPEQFDPERFNDRRAEDKSQSFSYIPFGGGLRECIGKELARLEMKIFAAMLTRRYEWELIANQNLKIDIFPVAHPIDGLKVNFRQLYNQ